MLLWAHWSVWFHEDLLRAFTTQFPCWLFIRLFVINFPFLNFAPKSFCLSCIQLLIWLQPFSPKLLLWNVLFCQYRIVSSRYLFSFLSFTSIFGWSPQAYFSSSCRAFSVSSEYFLMFCFTILVCGHNLFICDSSQSSHSGYDFLSVVFKGTPIFTQTNFAPGHIKSFNSMISFIGIYVNKSFTF